MRRTYVAATRARDLLVIPAIGDGPFDDSWVRPLNQALYPPVSERQSPRQMAGMPAFKSRDTVLERPDGDMPGTATVWPGAYSMVDASSGEPYTLVWWDPALIDRPGDDTRGLRRDDLISKDARVEDVAADRARYQKWQDDRAAVHALAAKPSLTVVTATEYVKGEAPVAPSPDAPVAVTVQDASAPGPRPGGRRFGVLVHALLAAAPLDASPDTIEELAVLHARLLGATDEERDAAAALVSRALAHDLLREAHQAAVAGRACRREVPISFMRDGVLIDGQIDLAFETGAGWVVVDFKTDAELGAAEDVYRRQVALYAEALASITRTPATATILRV
jgi:ATP-dependent helicase/nuclease subunit A